MAAEKVAVWLTRSDVRTLRGLIVREAKRLGHPHQHKSEQPSALKRLSPVAKKIWDAHLHFHPEHYGVSADE